MPRVVVLSITIVLIVSATALAQVAEIPATPDVPATDLSVRLLDSLFGDGWEDIIDNGTGNDVSRNMVNPILAIFNTIALAIISALFVWIMAQGVAGTAHEGKALGSRFSTLWTPLRGAISVSLLVPIVNGLSIFQVLMLMSIGWSVNVGNYIWQTGLNTFVNQGGMIIATPPAELNLPIKNAVAGALKNATIQEYYSQWEDMPLNGARYTAEWVDETQEYIIQFQRPEGLHTSPNVLGKIIIECPQGNDESLCQERLSATRSMIAEASGIAQQIVNPETSPNETAIVSVMDEYGSDLMDSIIDDYAGNPAIAEEMAAYQAQASASGWATAGSYYWSISAINNQRRNNIDAAINYIDADLKTLSRNAYQEFDKVMSAYEGYYRRSFLRNSPGTIAEATQAAASDNILGFIRKAFQLVFAEWMFSELAENLTENDPVATLTSYGHNMITGTQALFAAYVTTAAVVGASDNASDSIIGKVVGLISFSGTEAATGAASETFDALKLVVIIVMLALYSFAFTLAFYLPALPMILWLAAMAGWIILVLESLVAAPLWVAAHAMPEGDGFAGQYGRQGYFMFIAVVIRPALMVTGLLFSLVLMAAVGRLIGLSFQIIGITLSQFYTFGIASIVAMTVIMCGTLLVVAHKVYGLIVHFPNTVTNWIGQYINNLGEGQDEARIGRAFKETGSRSEGALNRGAGAVLANSGQAPRRRRVNNDDLSPMNRPS